MKKNYKAFYICVLFFVGLGFIKAQCTFTSSVPYYQGFAGVTTASPLPQCWASLGQAGTSTLGNGSAYFYFTPQGTNYFFTNGIQLYAGVNYSTSVWYLTNNIGSNNWTNLSIQLGSSQSSVGLTTLASTAGAAIAPVWTALSNTFSVAQSGIYYFALSGTSNGALGANYLTLDDFMVTIPCQLNTTSININATNTVLCLGQSVVLTATGANSYTWSTGSNSSAITVIPNGNVTYSVSGTNSVGCIATKSISVQVNPSPLVSIFPIFPSICLGESVTLFAVGGSAAASSTFSWSNGATTNTTVVSPTLTTNYSVTITNSFNCSGTAVQPVIVNPLPSVTATSSNSFVCAGDEVLITCFGAFNYTWTTSTGLATGTVNPFTKQLLANEFVTIKGRDGNGCTNTFTLNLNVKECAGLNEKTLEKRLYVFPNPSTDYLNLIGLNNSSAIEMYDLKGQLVYTKITSERHCTIDLKNFDKGLYVLQIVSGDERVERRIIIE